MLGIWCFLWDIFSVFMVFIIFKFIVVMLCDKIAKYEYTTHAPFKSNRDTNICKTETKNGLCKSSVHRNAPHSIIIQRKRINTPTITH